MNESDEPMPANFGPQYVFWIICRWLYKNPLTILLAMQSLVIQLLADYPTLKWLGTAGGILGMIIAQVRNKGTDYTVPLAQSKRDQAKAVLAADPSPSPGTPAQPQGATKP